ncbi:MAG: hypothetical protein J0I80_08085 [Sphingomonas sp.]|nr:hypothetical protein [Sphingomonas sp.]
MDAPIVSIEEWVRPRVADYLWHPWYAKLWWVAIPIYWLPAGAPFGIGFLADFYTSGVGLYLNLVFLPVTALAVLGFGFARRWRESEAWSETYSIEHSRTSALHQRTPGSPPAYMDPLSPLSGSIWIGNPKSQAERRGR